MIHELVRLRDRNQMTLPAVIAERLALNPGDLIELILENDGDHIELRHAEVVRAGTPQAKREEQWAKDDIKAGRFSTYSSPEELAASVRAEESAADLRDRVALLQQQMQALTQSLRKVGAVTGVQVDLPSEFAGNF